MSPNILLPTGRTAEPGFVRELARRHDLLSSPVATKSSAGIFAMHWVYFPP